MAIDDSLMGLTHVVRGKDLEIGFNARYLLDALTVVKEGNVVLELEHEQSPGILRIPDDPSYLAVIMPMRI